MKLFLQISIMVTFMIVANQASAQTFEDVIKMACSQEYKRLSSEIGAPDKTNKDNFTGSVTRIWYNGGVDKDDLEISYYTDDRSEKAFGVNIQPDKGMYMTCKDWMKSFKDK